MIPSPGANSDESDLSLLLYGNGSLDAMKSCVAFGRRRRRRRCTWKRRARAVERG